MNNYSLISPCRNEADYMRQTLDSVIEQSKRPCNWIIVDDGSTDETPRILAEYSEKHEWIKVITCEDRGHRAVGPGVIDAFYQGYEVLDKSEIDFFCKLDLDLLLPERYFEVLIERMNRNPRLGTCSGKSYIHEGGKLIQEKKGDETSLGMTKFYRLACFNDIGGFVRGVMWDGIDCHRCRMLGWRACSWDDPELRFIHLRPMGTSQKGVFAGRMRHGYGQYFMGTGFIYILASAFFRMTERPFVLGGLAIFWGWLRSAVNREKRYDDFEFRKFLRRYQMRALLIGKKKATEELDNWNLQHIELKHG